MNNIVFAFWEGDMPGYLKLCLDTWKVNFTILNYANIHNYMNEIPLKVKQLTLPKVADYIRAHVLKYNPGYWFDIDTIMLNDNLPDECILGNNAKRTNSIGYLNATKERDMFSMWADAQDYIVEKLPYMPKGDTTKWSIMGNMFTDVYLKEYPDVVIGDISKCFLEDVSIRKNIPRHEKYTQFYFNSNYNCDLCNGLDMLMLHNSWTPSWYKKLSKDDVLKQKCTLSNILLKYSM